MSRIVAREKAFQLVYLFEMRKNDGAEDLNEMMDNILDDIKKGLPTVAAESNEAATGTEPDDDSGIVSNEEMYVETEEDITDIIKSVLLQRSRNLGKGGMKEPDDKGFESAGSPILGDKKIDTQDYEYVKNVVLGVEDKKQELDELVEENAKGWKLSRIPIVDLSILRLAIYEIKYMSDIPIGVSINESVNLAKKFSSQDSSSFINGVLGSIVRK